MRLLYLLVCTSRAVPGCESDSNVPAVRNAIITMTSSKVGSPIALIFQQWTSQQLQRQKQSEDGGGGAQVNSIRSASSASYRILLQYSYSLQHRIQSAEPVDNPHLYRRAGVPTPAERATRDCVGGSETAWLLRLIELAARQNQVQSNEVKVIYVATRARTSGNLLIECLPQELQTRIQVVELASKNPWGWDSDDDNDNDKEEPCEEPSMEDGTASTATMRITRGANMKDLTTLHKHLKDQIMIGTETTGTTLSPVILIWQSLTPLFVVHGFDRFLRLLMEPFPTPCLQVWPVQVQTLTPKQHMQLEDSSNALLCMEGGEMTMIRQGIREPGKIIREQIPFRLHAIDLDDDDEEEEQELLIERCQFRRYRIVEGEEDVVDKTSGCTVPPTDDVHLRKGSGGTMMAAPTGTDRVPPGTGTTSSSSSSVSAGPGRPRIQLRMEEDNDVVVGRLGGTKTQDDVGFSTRDSVAQPIHRPRIYMQDDDPEFDDLDEEDPDDDLDI